MRKLLMWVIAARAWPTIRRQRWRASETEWITATTIIIIIIPRFHRSRARTNNAAVAWIRIGGVWQNPIPCHLSISCQWSWKRLILEALMISFPLLLLHYCSAKSIKIAPGNTQTQNRGHTHTDINGHGYTHTHSRCLSHWHRYTNTHTLKLKWLRYWFCYWNIHSLIIARWSLKQIIDRHHLPDRPTTAIGKQQTKHTHTRTHTQRYAE